MTKRKSSGRRKWKRDCAKKNLRLNDHKYSTFTITRTRGPTRRTRHETTHWLNDPMLTIDIANSPHRPPGNYTISTPLLLYRTVRLLVQSSPSVVRLLRHPIWERKSAPQERKTKRRNFAWVELVVRGRGEEASTPVDSLLGTHEQGSLRRLQTLLAFPPPTPNVEEHTAPLPTPTTFSSFNT